MDRNELQGGAVAHRPGGKPAEAHAVQGDRRASLARMSRIAGAVTAVLLLPASTTVAAKAAKRDFMYQDESRDRKSCSSCKFFAPDPRLEGAGTCAVVEGTVRSSGWCMAYAPRRQ